MTQHRSTQSPLAVRPAPVRVRVNTAAASTAVVALGLGFGAGLIVSSILFGQAVTKAQEARDLTVLRSELVASSIAGALATPCATDEQHDCWWVRTGTDQILVDIGGNVYPVAVTE